MLGRSRVALSAAAVLSSACAANNMDVLKESASTVMQCPKDQLTASQIAAEDTQQVSGCGKHELFTEAPTGGWVHVADLRKRASVDLSCPADQLILDPVAAGPTVAVEGCGKHGTYVYTVVSSSRKNSAFDWVAGGAAGSR